jgi:hypothetical protein
VAGDRGRGALVGGKGKVTAGLGHGEGRHGVAAWYLLWEGKRE